MIKLKLHKDWYFFVLEKHENQEYNVPKPQLYGRYIDDCIGATSPTTEELTHS